MKLFKKSVLMLALISAIAASAASLVSPQGEYIDGSTNTVTVAGTNAVVSYVPPQSTNFYLMPGQLVVNANTNLYPAILVENANNGQPLRNLSFQFIATGTNAAVATVRFAVSTDLSHWTSNYFWFTATMNGTGLAYGTPVFVSTNCDTYAFPYLALQSIESPNGGLTNIFLNPGLKPTW